MNVLVDTSVWSLALRRHSNDNTHRKVLEDLISDSRVALLGAVRQELLSGVKHLEQFETLREALRPFQNIKTTIADYELAAEYFNLCRSNGIQGANTDFLICAVSVNHNYQILTTDRNFRNFSEVLPIELYGSGEGSL